jgi:hypothetical protein
MGLTVFCLSYFNMLWTIKKLCKPQYRILINISILLLHFIVIFGLITLIKGSLITVSGDVWWSNYRVNLMLFSLYTLPVGFTQLAILRILNILYISNDEEQPKTKVN